MSEPDPVADLLRENTRQTVLHGGSVRRGHEDMDGCDRDRGRGLHAVHELRQSTKAFSRETRTSYSQREKKMWFSKFPVSWRCCKLAQLRREVFTRGFPGSKKEKGRSQKDSLAIQNAFYCRWRYCSVAAWMRRNVLSLLTFVPWHAFPMGEKCQMTSSHSGNVSAMTIRWDWLSWNAEKWHSRDVFKWNSRVLH